MHWKFRNINFKGNGDGEAATGGEKAKRFREKNEGERGTTGQREEGRMLFVKSDHF